MQEHLNQAQYNEQFIKNLDSAFPNDYYDWRVTLVFYTALHYLQATASLFGKDIGNNHDTIKSNIGKGGKLQLKPWVVNCYKNLESYAREARYSGFLDVEIFQQSQKKNYEMASLDLADFKKYLREEKGLPIP